MPKQLRHSETQLFSLPNAPVVICDNITIPANIGMLLRVAEAMGVKQVFCCGEGVDLANKKITKVARSTDSLLTVEAFPDVLDCVLRFKKNGYSVVSLELTDESVDLRQFTFNSERNYVFVVGAENYGVSAEVLIESDAVIAIPMFGANSSMNVVTSLSMFLFEYVRQAT